MALNQNFPPELLASFQCPQQIFNVASNIDSVSNNNNYCWHESAPPLVINHESTISLMNSTLNNFNQNLTNLKCPFGHHKLSSSSSSSSSLKPFPQYLCVDYLRNQCYNENYVINTEYNDQEGVLPPRIVRCGYGFHPTITQLFQLEEYLTVICQLFNQPIWSSETSVNNILKPKERKSECILYPQCILCHRRIPFSICHFELPGRECRHLYCASCYTANQPQCPICDGGSDNIRLTRLKPSTTLFSSCSTTGTYSSKINTNLSSKTSFNTTVNTKNNNKRQSFGKGAFIHNGGGHNLQDIQFYDHIIYNNNDDEDFFSCLAIVCIIGSITVLIIGSLYIISIYWRIKK